MKILRAFGLIIACPTLLTLSKLFFANFHDSFKLAVNLIVSKTKKKKKK